MVRTKTPGRLSSRSSDFHAKSELNRSAERSLGGAGTLAFLVLQGLLAGETVVGFEDRRSIPLNDFDYNDHIFSFTNVGLKRPSVPEPATLLLLGGGVAGFIARRRRSNER